MKIQAETIRRLAQPLVEEGATELYLTAHANRIYVGRVPAAAIRGAEGEPHNVRISAEDVYDATRLQSACTVLEELLS